METDAAAGTVVSSLLIVEPATVSWVVFFGYGGEETYFRHEKQISRRHAEGLVGRVVVSGAEGDWFNKFESEISEVDASEAARSKSERSERSESSSSELEISEIEGVEFDGLEGGSGDGGAVVKAGWQRSHWGVWGC